jgi:hypothetical protein
MVKLIVVVEPISRCKKIFWTVGSCDIIGLRAEAGEENVYPPGGVVAVDDIGISVE